MTGWPTDKARMGTAFAYHYSCLPQGGSVPSGLGLGFEGGFHDGSELNV
jgi:hypothetical protein